MTGPLPWSLCKYRIYLCDQYVSSKYCLLHKERIIDCIIAITGCDQFRQKCEHSRVARAKKCRIVEEAIRAISQNVKVFQAVRRDKKEQSKLRKVFAVYRLYYYLGFATGELAILLDETKPKVEQHIGEAFKHTCLKEESCWAKPLLSNYV